MVLGAGAQFATPTATAHANRLYADRVALSEDFSLRTMPFRSGGSEGSRTDVRHRADRGEIRPTTRLGRAFRWLLKCLAILVGAVTLLTLALLLAAPAFFHYMSLGYLRPRRPGGNVVVALAHTAAVLTIMHDVCESPGGDGPAAVSAATYSKLLSGGALAKVPGGTRISLISWRTGNSQLLLSWFTIRSGPLQGREAWSCPDFPRLEHAPL